MREEIITVGASCYFQPILDLCERLIQRPRETVRASRINYRENGYSRSIVLLSVVMLEAFVGRVSDQQSRLGTKGQPIARREKIPEYITKLRKSFTLEKSLTEVFVLRDAIAHGHVWSLEVSDHATRGAVLHSSRLGPGYGDNKHKDRVNPRTRRTRALGLHIVPAAVGRSEVIKVIDVIHRVLTFLARKGLLERNTLACRGRFQGKPFDFWHIIESLRKAP